MDKVLHLGGVWKDGQDRVGDGLPGYRNQKLQQGDQKHDDGNGRDHNKKGDLGRVNGNPVVQHMGDDLKQKILDTFHEASPLSVIVGSISWRAEEFKGRTWRNVNNPFFSPYTKFITERMRRRKWKNI